MEQSNSKNSPPEQTSFKKELMEKKEAVKEIIQKFSEKLGVPWLLIVGAYVLVEILSMGLLFVLLFADRTTGE